MALSVRNLTGGAVALALAASLPLVAAAPASAVGHVVQDEASCNEFRNAIGAGGTFTSGNQCYVSTGTLPAADVLTVTNGWSLRVQFNGTDALSFTNAGTITGPVYGAGQFVNNGTLNVVGSSSNYSAITNNGTINLTAGANALYNAGTIANSGAIVVNDAATLRNVGTINNPGTLTLQCGGIFDADPGSTLTGNAPVENCNNPTITATLTSAQPANAAGWYRTPVTITYQCTAGAGGTIDANGCPPPDVVTTEGAAVTRTATVRQTNHGFDTVTVTLKIDLTAPAVTVHGVTSGASYTQPPAITCAATDALSGLAGGCSVTTSASPRVGEFAYVGTARDVAGNETRSTGSYLIDAPETSLTLVKIATSRGKATFKFAGAGNVQRFECALAKKGKKGKKLKYRTCTKAKYKKLAKGKYTFAVRAVGLGGPDPTPATKKFKIKP